MSGAGINMTRVTLIPIETGTSAEWWSLAKKVALSVVIGAQMRKNTERRGLARDDTVIFFGLFGWVCKGRPEGIVNKEHN